MLSGQGHASSYNKNIMESHYALGETATTSFGYKNRLAILIGYEGCSGPVSGTTTLSVPLNYHTQCMRTYMQMNEIGVLKHQN